jgi:hypothetical protein
MNMGDFFQGQIDYYRARAREYKGGIIVIDK